jgi:3-(3-hydroxy-phenyl)propionate hydroxylase
MAQTHIIIAGAGPVGVVSALALAQFGYAVTLLEADAMIDDNPRAATTHPSTLEMIARVGLIDRFIQDGLVARYFQFWDKPRRTKIVEFDHELLRGETPFPFVVQTEQHKLARMGIERLKTFADVEVRFNTRVTGVSQGSDSVTVTAEGPNGVESFRGDWAIGADGGRSTVRKALAIEFEGFTWPEHFLVLTITDDFEQLLGGCCYRNYLADPDEWTNLFKVAGDDGKGRWRAVFPTRVDESDEQALGDESTYSRLQRVYPLTRRYHVVHRNLYKVHQRVAATFRKGRVMLAGDSAHVNNSVGGLGLNSGIHDAMELVDTLHEIIENKADHALLDRYTRRRRTSNIESVQEQTIANKKRLEERDPSARRAKFDELRAAADDPSQHKAFLLRTSLIASVRQARSIA